jgi:DNA-binding MarR family transcriptional regulator
MGKVDDAAAILELSTDDRSLGELARKLKTSRDELNTILTLLESKQLIRLRRKANDIRVDITERGIKFLDLYNSLKSKFLKIPAE